MNKFTSLMQQINYVLFFVLVVSFPLPRNIILWCWILWAVTWLLEFRFLNPKNIQWGKRMIPALFLFGWTIWECISLIWGKNIGLGGSFPDQHISLLFYPLIFLYGVNDHYDWKKIAKIFIFACVSSFFLYCWLLYWISNYQYVFMYGGECPMVPFQFNYFDIYFSFIKHRMFYCSSLGVATILLFMLRKDLINDWGKWKTYLFMVFCIAVFFTAILATGSRANILTLVAIGAVALIRQVKRYRPVIISAILVAAIGCCLVIWKFHPRMKDLTVEQITHIEDHFDDPNMQPRVVIWYLALQHPEDYLAKGLGVGNVQEYMGLKYDVNNLTMYRKDGLQTHNQYLYLLIELGLAALLLFIFFWYYIPFCFPKGSQAREFALYFVLLFGINMLTDDNLSRLEPTIYTCTFLLLADIMAKATTDKAPLNA